MSNPARQLIAEFDRQRRIASDLEKAVTTALESLKAEGWMVTTPAFDACKRAGDRLSEFLSENAYPDL